MIIFVLFGAGYKIIVFVRLTLMKFPQVLTICSLIFGGGLLQVISFLMNWKYSVQNWLRLCMNWMFCRRTLRSMAGGIFRMPIFVSAHKMNVSNCIFS